MGWDGVSEFKGWRSKEAVEVRIGEGRVEEEKVREIILLEQSRAECSGPTCLGHDTDKHGSMTAIAGSILSCLMEAFLPC